MGVSFAFRLLTHLTLAHYNLRLKAQAENAIPDELFEKRFERWPVDTPSTKEAYYIRDVFDGRLTQYGSFQYPHMLTKLVSLNRLVPVRRRSENSCSVCTTLFVEPTFWLS
jgi:hypothetical protein